MSKVAKIEEVPQMIEHNVSKRTLSYPISLIYDGNSVSQVGHFFANSDKSLCGLSKNNFSHESTEGVYDSQNDLPMFWSNQCAKCRKILDKTEDRWA
jgi:F0F1-type ATP synthase gamma subunit